jgi:hypothetical protein
MKMQQPSISMPTKLGNGDYIWSAEGTTQGDPLALTIFGVAIWPLIQKAAALLQNLHSRENSTEPGQFWYADDSACKCVYLSSSAINLLTSHINTITLLYLLLLVLEASSCCFLGRGKQLRLLITKQNMMERGA